MANNVQLTREQLAKFLPDQRAIVAFEQVLNIASTSSTPVLTNLTVTGNSSLNTITSSGLATLASLTVTGATNLFTLATSGLATLAFLTVTGATNLLSLTVSGVASLATLSTSGLATLASLTVTGASNLSTLATSGLATLASLTVTGATSVSTLVASGAITPSQTAGIAGTTTNNSANAGSVGEITSVNTSTAVVTGVNTDIASISLTAGQWLVTGSAYMAAAGATSTSNWGAGISVVSAGLPGIPLYHYQGIGTTAGQQSVCAVPSQILQLSATTTVYMVAFVNFGGGACNVQGYLLAERQR